MQADLHDNQDAPESDPSEDALARQRAEESADRIFTATGLDQELDDPQVAEARQAVSDGFTRWADEGSGRDDG